MTQAAFTHTYKISAYPKENVLQDATKVTIRPMVTRDEEPLLEFFLRVPEEDRYYLKEDVTSPAVIRKWIEFLDYDRVLPLLAVADGAIVADATLHRRRASGRRHAGEIRIVVDPAYRGKGLGTALMRELISIAAEAGLETIVMELAEEAEKDAVYVAEHLGFIQVAILRNAIKDPHNKTQNMVLLELPLPKWYQWWNF
jgi:GNAT superfamily N-acetyltransferase